MQFSLDFPYAQGKPQITAFFRSENADFIVEEDLGIEFTHEGEHLYLKLKKEGENTHWVATELAKYFKVKDNDVGYAGKKDRNAITTQWFSVYLPGIRDIPNLDTICSALEGNIEIIDSAIHKQKLRKGRHKANLFKIRLRSLSSIDGLEERLQILKQKGAPNYFGEQRFGWGANNLQLADEWFSGKTPIKNRNKKGLVLSAARSYLFNIVLAKRVEAKTWLTHVDGESLIEGQGSAPLWGRGRSSATSDALDIENQVLESYSAWCDALEHKGLNQERRALSIQPMQVAWQLDEQDLRLEFALPPGQFATSVLRELFILSQPERVPSE